MIEQKVKSNNFNPNNNIPHLNPNIEIYPFDVSSKLPKYLVVENSKKRLEISGQLYNILSLIDGKRTKHQIAEEFSSKTGKSCSAADIEKVIQDYLIPQGLIAGENGKNHNKGKSYLYFKIPFFSQELLRPITNILKIFFQPIIFKLCLLLITIEHTFLYTFFDKSDFTIKSLSGFDYFYIYLIFFISTLFHELGHSSACNYFGAKYGPIGFGLYLYFPVFYADVSDAWKLNRKQRIVIDLAGMYFQLLSTIILFVFYFMFKENSFIFSIFALDFIIVMSLNPLLRWDGYWLFSDIAGVPNLRKRARGILKYFVKKIFSRQAVPSPLILQIRTKEKYFLYFYAIVSNLFFIYFGYQILTFAPNLIVNYPKTLRKFGLCIYESVLAYDFNGALNALLIILFPTIILLMISIMIYRFLSTALRQVKRKIFLKKIGKTVSFNSET